MASIMADIYRLYAPDSPYSSEHKQKQIFRLFNKHLAFVGKGAKDPCFNYNVRVLELISTVQIYYPLADLKVLYFYCFNLILFFCSFFFYCCFFVCGKRSVM